jgi:hypothetical protein
MENKRNGGFAFWMKKKARPMEIKEMVDSLFG